MAELVDSDPNDPTVRLANFEYRRRYNLPNADVELNKALELGPDVPAVRLAAAEYLRHQGEQLLEARRLDFSEGGGESETASSVNPNELFAQAREHLEHVLEQNPNSESAYVALGDVYATEGQLDKAKSEWEKGLNTVGKASLSLNMRMAEALAREASSKTGEHLERLGRALEALRPTTSPEVKNSLTRTRDLIAALWLLQQHKPAQAIPLLKPIAAEGHGLGTRYADSVKALQMLAQAHRSLDQWEEAARAYELAAELSPDDWRYRLGAAAMWQAADQPQLAIAHLQRVVDAIDTPGAWMALASSQYEATSRRPSHERDWEPFEKALAQTRAKIDGKEFAQAWLVDLLEANYRLATATDKQVGRA